MAQTKLTMIFPVALSRDKKLALYERLYQAMDDLNLEARVLVETVDESKHPSQRMERETIERGAGFIASLGTYPTGPN